MSIISAGTTSGTALVQTADTNGNLVIKTGASGTTAMTVGANQVTDFAATPTINGGAFPAGAMTLISTKTANNNTSLEWTGLTGYNNYLLIFNSLTLDSQDSVGIRFGTGSTTYLTSGYAFSGYRNPTSGTGTMSITNSSSTTISSLLPVTAEGSSISALELSGQFFIFDMTNSRKTRITTQSSSTGSSETAQTYSGVCNNTTAKTAIRIITVNETSIFTSGTASLYGITS